MKKIIFLVLLLCVAGFAHAEMIVNGDFEAGMSGWSNWGSGSGSGTAGYLWWSGSASIAPSGGSDGGQYAVLDTTALDGYMDSWGWCWQGVWQQDLPATPGETITISGYVKDISLTGDPCHVLNVFYEWEDSAGDRVDYDGNGSIVNNEDRTRLKLPLTGGGDWDYFTADYVVPTEDLLGNPFANPIAQFDFMVSVEGAPYSFGVDQLTFAGAGAANVYPPNGSKNVPTTAVLQWGPPPTFTPIAYDAYLTTDPNANKPEHLVVDHANQTEFDPDPNLAYNTKYYWRVDAYDPCDVIRIPSVAWSFTTVPTWPVFTTDAKGSTVEADSSAEFYVQTLRATDFKWYKEGDPCKIKHGDDGGDISVVSDVDSSTLTISNVELADEGYYYCVADNGDPCTPESNHARLLTKRLMGHWKFNAPLANALNDEVAGNHGTLVDPNVLNPPPGLPALAQGNEGQAINLGADEIYVDIPNQEYFNFHAQGFTVSAWIKTEQDDWGVVVSKTDRKQPRTGWLLHHYGDSAYMNLRENGEVSYNGGLTDNAWHMLVGTYDGDTGILALYVDGKKQSEAGPIWTLTETDMPLKIGTELGSDYPEGDSIIDYEGLIDDVKILSYAQDPYEVATEYTDNGGDPVCAEPLPGDLNDDCVINTADLVEVVLRWLECNLVPESACDE